MRKAHKRELADRAENVPAFNLRSIVPTIVYKRESRRALLGRMPHTKLNYIRCVCS